jgi:transcriptional regulator with XRE-family HTH domain
MLTPVTFGDTIPVLQEQDMEFGDLLRHYRENVADVTQTALAAAVGIDPSWISKMERKRRPPPSRDVLLALALALHLTPEQTDDLLLAAGYEPETVFDVPGLDPRDEHLRALLHEIAALRAKGPAGQAWVELVGQSILLLVQGARHQADAPIHTSRSLVPPPPIAPAPLTAEEEEIDDLLTLALSGHADGEDFAHLASALTSRPMAWELRRRVAEALPHIAVADSGVACDIAEGLRSDYDPDKFRTDVRRRVVEAVPALYAVAPERAVGLLEPRSDDEVYVAIATLEVLHDLPQVSSSTASRIRHQLAQLEQASHSGVVNFLAGLLDLVAAGRGREALLIMKEARERERVFRICVARTLPRLFDSPLAAEALWFALYLLRRVAGQPAEHANVRRPLAMALPDLVRLLPERATPGLLARVVIQTLAQDPDHLIRRGVADELPGIAAKDLPLARETVRHHMMDDVDPYVRRRAWRALVELEPEVRGA